MGSGGPRPTRYQRTSAEAKRMLRLGESGRFEFKQNAEAVSVGVLAALANWVASDESRAVAHLLVGVQEVEDHATGLVRGEPRDLPKGLDRAVARIQDLAGRTRPIPVDVFIIEEGVAETTPFLRIEVRPTIAPHFDDEGRRQTRNGRSTRALTDEELLQIYLKREAGSFAARFQQVSEALHEAVGGIGSQVESIADAIETPIAQPLTELTETAGYAASAASSAEDAATTVSFEVNQVEQLVRELQGAVEGLQNESVSSLPAELMRKRQFVWLDFAIETYERNSPVPNAGPRSCADSSRPTLPLTTPATPGRSGCGTASCETAKRSVADGAR
jgi:hypothetical protein